MRACFQGHADGHLLAVVHRETRRDGRILIGRGGDRSGSFHELSFQLAVAPNGERHFGMGRISQWATVGGFGEKPLTKDKVLVGKGGEGHQSPMGKRDRRRSDDGASGGGRGRHGIGDGSKRGLDAAVGGGHLTDGRGIAGERAAIPRPLGELKMFLSRGGEGH